MIEAGGQPISEPHFNTKYEDTDGNQTVYVKTPWGSLIELQTVPNGYYYPESSEAEVFIPPKSKTTGLVICVHQSCFNSEIHRRILSIPLLKIHSFSGHSAKLQNHGYPRIAQYHPGFHLFHFKSL